MNASSLHLPTLLAMCALGASAATGCGGAQRGDDLHAAFAEIQVQEARIEHAAHDLSEGGSEADLACDEMRDAATRLCEVAEPTHDRDAAARCERARERATRCVSLASTDAADD